MPANLILIVEPESKWVHLLRQVLSGAGFAVQTTNRGEKAVKIAAEEQPALVLTETTLAGEMDGADLIRKIRTFSEKPVIMLSSRDSAEEEIRAFEAGADDFIRKPFDSRILLARVKAVLSRSRESMQTPTRLDCGDIQIDLAARQVTASGQPVYLTETEYNLLLELARHQNQVMLHEQLLMAVWGPKFSTEVDYLRSFIHILRRKLEINPSQPSLILSRPGIGYILVSADKPQKEALPHGKRKTL